MGPVRPVSEATLTQTDGRSCHHGRNGCLSGTSSPASRAGSSDTRVSGAVTSRLLDGRTLATWEWYSSDDNGEDTVRLFDIERGEQILTLEPGSRASVMEFSPDGMRLYTGLHQSSGIVWDVRRVRTAAKAKE